MTSNPGRSVKAKVIKTVDTIRWGPSLCVAATLLAGVALSIPDLRPDRLLLTTVLVVLGFVHVNLYNYFTDVEEDERNGRYNPIRDDRKALYIRSYLVASAVLVLLISAVWLSMLTFWLSAVGLLLGYLYSHEHFRFKERLAVKNITIGIGYGLVLLIFRSGLAGGVTTVDVVVALFFSFFSVTGSTTRDVFDIEGDREAGVATVPAEWGLAGTGQFLTVVTVLQLLSIVVPAVLGLVPTAYLALLVVAPLLFKRPYYVYKGRVQRLDPKGIPGIVATSLLLLGVNVFQML